MIWIQMEWMSHHTLAGDEIYEKELEKIIVKDNNKYIKKLELGKMIYENGGRRCSTSFTTTYERTSGFIFEDKCGIISYRYWIETLASKVHSTSWFPLGCWKSFDTNDDIVNKIKFWKLKVEKFVPKLCWICVWNTKSGEWNGAIV